MSETPPPPAAAKKAEAEDSLLGHLMELRGCLLRSVIVLVVLLFAIFPFAGGLYNWLALPLLAELTDGELIAISVLGPFTVQITVAFFFAIWLAAPYLLWEAWRFVAPGLYQNEKRLLAPTLISGTILFTVGMVFAYFIVFKMVFGFIAGIAPAEVKWTPDVSEYFSFMVKIFLAFGLAFETPVVVFILARAGIVELETMRQARPYVIVGAFVIAAIVTPPDVISQLLLAVPCWLLYEVGLLLAPKRPKKQRQRSPAAGA